tara:strand:- start:23591 stop:23881 length:291 start_codon:yes stop_codon:yes gene_type:complete
MQMCNRRINSLRDQEIVFTIYYIDLRMVLTMFNHLKVFITIQEYRTIVSRKSAVWLINRCWSLEYTYVMPSEREYKPRVMGSVFNIDSKTLAESTT